MGRRVTTWPWEYLDDTDIAYRRVAASCDYDLEDVSVDPSARVGHVAMSGQGSQRCAIARP